MTRAGSSSHPEDQDHDVEPVGPAEQEEVGALAGDVEQRLGDGEAAQHEQLDQRPQVEAVRASRLRRSAASSGAGPPGAGFASSMSLATSASSQLTVSGRSRTWPPESSITNSSSRLSPFLNRVSRAMAENLSGGPFGWLPWASRSSRNVSDTPAITPLRATATAGRDTDTLGQARPAR